MHNNLIITDGGGAHYSLGNNVSFPLEVSL